MANLNKTLRALKLTSYLNGQFNAKSNVFNINLLANGVRLSEQLQHKWQTTKEQNVQTKLLSNNYQTIESTANRLSFTHSTSFREIFDSMKTTKLEIPAITKQLITHRLNSDEPDLVEQNVVVDVITADNMGKFLVTDYFVPLSSGLEKFYNIQRERKIWWMTFSNNPSRYSLEAYELPNRNTGSNDSTNHHQSITIISRFSFGTIAMEHITLVPLFNETSRPNELFLSTHNKNNSKAVPAVIRSVINLETATCGLLMDAYDYKRTVLRLNRKISPYQMMVVGVQKEQSSGDLTDLCAYISLLLHKAGLRLFENVHTLSTAEERLTEALQSADNMGIPYTILVENESLKCGLLKLRSRDTTLHESIHISDIPDYLIKIFLST